MEMFSPTFTFANIAGHFVARKQNLIWIEFSSSCGHDIEIVSAVVLFTFVVMPEHENAAFSFWRWAVSKRILVIPLLFL